MANGMGLNDGVPILVEGVPGAGEPPPLLKLSSTVRVESCLMEALSFSGTDSPARHLLSSASYLEEERGREGSEGGRERGRKGGGVE